MREELPPGPFPSGRRIPLGRWGSGGHGLDRRTRDFARTHLGDPQPSPVPLERDLRPSRLSVDECRRLFAGVEAVVDDRTRAGHARGASYADLLTWRSRAGAIAAPDVVVFPVDHEQTLEVVRTCSQEGFAVVPYGGGTSVTGGVNTPQDARLTAVVAVSTARLDRLSADQVLDLDAVSGTALVGAGITGPELEDHLAPEGWTLGHFPQSWQRASIGGFIAARSSGQASSGYGRIEDMLISARLATPVGTWEVGGFPAASTGPDLRHLVLGSEGTLGVITSARLRLRPRPRIRRFAAALIPGEFKKASACVRALARSPLRPAVLRVSDSAETAALLAMSMPGGMLGSIVDSYLRVRRGLPGSLVICGWEGERESLVSAARAEAKDALVDAVWLGARPGRGWERGRFHGPFLRDALMDEGYLVETFETVTTWANIDHLHSQVAAAARSVLGENSYVMAHISHTYDTGASLYFTVLAGGWSDPDESTQRWLAAKAAILDAIVDGGGAISHHHGIGRDHRAWLPAQIGEVGVQVLESVRSSVDPHRVMNPGALLADGGGPS